MAEVEPRFALNHIIAPGRDPAAFFALAAELGIGAVEIRNDLAGNAILDGTPAADIAGAGGGRRGLRILSINALQRFNDWGPERAAEAVALADYAAGCGAEAVVLVPSNDGTPPGRAARGAARGWRRSWRRGGWSGWSSRSGFATCAVRLKSEAAAAIAAVGGGVLPDHP